MRYVTVLGAGLLVGTALAVIIPEGVHALYMSDTGINKKTSQVSYDFYTFIIEIDHPKLESQHKIVPRDVPVDKNVNVINDHAPDLSKSSHSHESSNASHSAIGTFMCRI